MPQSVMTSREFNQDTGRAKRAARNGPVIITDHGKPAHVLLSYEDFRKISPASGKTIGELLALPGIENIELDIPRYDEKPKEIDFD